MNSLRLNVGSGQRPFSKPWLNVDVQERWKPDVVADGSHMPMFQDGSAELIVLHHVLEHFGCGEGDGMLRECHRILRPDGKLIVTVPDMRILAHGLLAGRITEETYLINIYGAYMGDEADRHKFGFTTMTLSDTLHAAGFYPVVPFDFRFLTGADIAKDWWILGMEATK